VSFALSTALKDLRRRRRDPLSLVLWLAIPLVVGLLLSLAFGGGGDNLRARLLVADRDGSLVARLLVGAFGQGRLGELVQVEEVEEAAGRARLDAGDASALLVIPSGFGAAVLDERPAVLTLVENPAQRILPRIVEESLSVMLEAGFYAQRLARGPVRLALERTRGAGAPADSTVADASVAINALVRRVQPYLFPPALTLEVKRPPEAVDERGFAELFFPSMLFLALLFMGRGLSGDLWVERRQGTLRRIASAPRRPGAFLAGKLLAGAALVALVGAVGLAAGRWVFGVRLANLPLALLWITLAGTVMLALFSLVQLYAKSERGGDVLTSAALFPLAMAGGSFFPFEVMPAWLAAIGRRTPNGWALSELTAILNGRTDALALAAAFAAVVAVGALAFVVAARRFREFARR
jgi:ABC-type Na+ efflux pump permease subunit